MTDVVLGGRGEDRLGKTIGLAQALREFNAADGAGLLVVLPAGAGEITADDTFDRKHLRPLDQHAAALELRCIRLKLRRDSRWILAQ